MQLKSNVSHNHAAGQCGYGTFGATINGGDVSAASDLYQAGVGCGACYQVVIIRGTKILWYKMDVCLSLKFIFRETLLKKKLQLSLTNHAERPVFLII